MKVERRDILEEGAIPTHVKYQCDALVVSADAGGIRIEGVLNIETERDVSRFLRVVQRAQEQRDWLQGSSTPLPSDERFLG